MRALHTLSLLAVLLLPCLALAEPFGGTWFFAGTVTPIYFSTDYSGSLLDVRYNYAGLLGQGTLARVAYGSYSGTVYQTNGLCTTGLYTTITFYSLNSAISRVRGSDGGCGVSPFTQLDVQFYR